MSSIESLKEQARRHEQREEWQKALDLYVKANIKLEEAEQPDIGLTNRVGDLHVRLGHLDAAMVQYERAVDLYMESELPNNAIAVCKKVLRNVPQRPSIHLKIGQIRAAQGFLVDARKSFLTYAESMQKAGNIEEAYRALGEFADLAPEDTDVRMMVATQMEQHGMAKQAVEHLKAGYVSLMQRGDEAGAGVFEAKVRGIDPTAVMPDVSAMAAAGLGGFETTSLTDEDPFGAFGEIVTRDEEEDEEASEGAEVEVGGGFDFQPAGEPEVVEAAAFVLAEDDEDEEAAEPLPTFGLEDDEDEVAEPLPTFGLEDDDEEAEPLPTFGLEEEDEEGALDAAAFGARDRGEREDQEYVEGPQEMGEVEVDLDLNVGAAESLAAAAEEAAGEQRGAGDSHQDLAERGDMEGAMAALREVIERDPDEVAHRQRMVEYAFRASDDSVLVSAYLEMAGTLERVGQIAKSRAVYQQVLAADPNNARAKAALGAGPAKPSSPVREVASSEEYVDLGSLILDDDEDEEKSTRFVVAYEEPSGDEEADFAKMLTQFKAKVAETFSADDVQAHHDLGTAYKEMGLLDEAIGEFQQALRASADHLPTYELLGQCFLDKGEAQAAVRSLSRALEVDNLIEDDLLGIYYYLGRAHESVGNTDSALEFYDKVFALDINFADVTERLRALR